MKNVQACALMVLVMLAAVGRPAGRKSLESRIVDLERQELDSLKSGNHREFASLLAEDAVFIDEHGRAEKAAVVNNTAALQLKEYAMEDLRFVGLAEKSRLVTYKITDTGVSQGEKFAEKAYVSAAWVERGGKWLRVFSQETPARQ